MENCKTIIEKYHSLIQIYSARNVTGCVLSPRDFSEPSNLKELKTQWMKCQSVEKK